MRLGITLTWALLSIASLLQGASAQISQPLLNDKADAFIQQLLQAVNSPGGLSVAVVSKDSNGQWRKEVKGYGNATVDGTKFTEKTVIGIGSNPKLFTALATGLLVHNETLSPRLDWTTKLAKVIPGFDLQDPIAAKGANILDALAHRTGLPRHDTAFKKNETYESLIRKLKYQRPSAELRESWQYNNNVYDILSYLPTALLPSKIPFARYVKEHFLDPLGMTHTTYSSAVANATGLLAQGMVTTDAGDALPLPYWLPTGPDGTPWNGAGGAISTAEDMATWLQFLLLKGRNPKSNETVVPEDVFERLTAGLAVETGNPDFPELSPVSYIGGQEIGTYQGVYYVEHGGDTPGFHSIVTRCPYNEFGVAIFSNDQAFGVAISKILRFWFLEQAFGLKEIDWVSRYLALAQATTFVPTPRPANATFPFGKVSALAGKYNNLGYGPAEFCYASSNASSASSTCKELLADPEIKSLGISPDVPTLVAKWNHNYVSYYVMSHVNGPIFNLTGYDVIPTGQSKAPFYAIRSVIDASAEVDKDLNGIALSGIWGPGADVPEPTGKTAQERAEVWFTRTH